MNKPFVDLRQNGQYPLLRLQLFELVSIYLEKSHNLMNELIMSVKGLAIYSAAGYKNLAGISSGPVDVSDRRSFNSRKTSWNVTDLKVKVSFPVRDSL